MTDDTAVRRWAADHRALLAVVAVTALALVARLVALGWRVMHWDEGRVGYVILRYAETGEWHYRPIVHGPFLPQVNHLLFELVGANDFVARFPVALVGGLLPLVAWLLREHLRDDEMVGLALLLACNPILLYYSRFMRNDVLVAGFSLFAVAFFVRAIDADSRRHLYAGVAALALAFTTKENAVIYVGIWAGALVLLFDHRLFLAHATDPDVDELGVAGHYVAETARALWRWRVPLVVSVVEFLAIIVVFYAPRPEFGQLFANPALVPKVVDDGTVGAWQAFYGQWVTGTHQDHQYIPFFQHYVQVLGAGALALVALSVPGFLVDRYADDQPRDVVAFAAYWGFVSVLIYPLVTDIPAPWNTVHAVVPLAIPAAVALGAIYRRGRVAYDAGDRVGVGLAALVLLVVAWQVGGTAVGIAYLHPQERSPMVQYGQPEGQLKPTLAEVGAIAASHDGGPDVLYFGEHFYVSNEQSALNPPATGNWYNRLPLPWYLELDGATPTSSTTLSALNDPPPVVITTKKHADEVGPRLRGYTAHTYLLTQDIPGNQVYVVVYVNRQALQQARA